MTGKRERETQGVPPPTRPLAAGLVVLALAGCVDVPTSALLEDVTPIAAPLPRGNEPILRYPPYPIHLRWWICEDHEDCRGTMREVPADSLPDPVAEGMRMAAKDVARLLSPTIPSPLVIPAGGERRYVSCWGADEHLAAGDTISAGLTVHVMFHPNWYDPHYGAAAGGCRIWNGEQWAATWGDKSVMGVIFVPCGWCDRTDGVPWRYDGERWRRTFFHEFSHVLGAVGGSGLSTVEEDGLYWLTDSTVVAAFDRAGGTDYPGRKVPLADRSHWHRCIGRGDSLAGSGYENSRITDLTIAAFHPGFQAEARGGLDDPEHQAWDDCPEFQSSSYRRSAPRVNDWLGYDTPERGRRP